MTALGAALGVAVLFGVLSTNAGIDRSLQRALGSDAVPFASVEGLGAYGQRLPAEALDRAAALPEVRMAFGSVWFPTVVAKGEPQEVELWVRGGDSREGERSSDPYPDGEDREPVVIDGREPAPGADEVSLSAGRARELGVAMGERLTVTTPSGPASLLVVRLIEGGDGAGYTSIDTARRLADVPSGYTDVGVTLAEGTIAAAWAREHAPTIGDGLTLRTGHGDELRAFVATVRAAFAGVALVAIFVGGFLVYLTMSMSVAERTKTWGTLRAVGASRGDIVRAVLAEAVVLSVAATVGGAVLGVAFAAALARLVGGVYDVPVDSFVVTPFVVGAVAVVGLLVPPVAAVLPAWRAANAQPVEAIRDAQAERPGIGRGWLLGLVLLGAGFAVVWFVDDAGVGTGPLLVLLGSVLLVPPVVGPLARGVGWITSRVSPGLGDVAVGHLVHERRRSAYTLSLVMVVLAMVLALGGVQTSITSSISAAFGLRFGEQVNVYSNTAFDGGLLDRFRNLDEVQRSTPLHSGSADIVEPVAGQVELVVVDAPTFFAMTGFRWAGGSDAEAKVAFSRGGAVAVPAAFAEDHGLEAGDEVVLETVDGPRSFDVAGVYETPETQVRLLAGLPDAVALRAARPTALGLQAAEGVSSLELERVVEAVLGERSGYWVSRIESEELDAVTRVRAAFRPFLAVIGVATVVGMLGLANTLAMAVLRRTRELGVLRAVGIGRGQLALMVLVESMTLAGVALVLSLGLGWVLTRALLRTSTAALGFTIEPAMPVRWIVLVGAVALAIAVLGAAGPSRRIARLDPAIALRHEL